MLIFNQFTIKKIEFLKIVISSKLKTIKFITPALILAYHTLRNRLDSK